MYALIVCEKADKMVEQCLSYGVDKVFVYENIAYKDFNIETYTNAIEHFYKKHQNNVILFGSTPQGKFCT